MHLLRPLRGSVKNISPGSIFRVASALILLGHICALGLSFLLLLTDAPAQPSPQSGQVSPQHPFSECPFSPALSPIREPVHALFLPSFLDTWLILLWAMSTPCRGFLSRHQLNLIGPWTVYPWHWLSAGEQGTETLASWSCPKHSPTLLKTYIVIYSVFV